MYDAEGALLGSIGRMYTPYEVMLLYVDRDLHPETQLVPDISLPLP